VVIVIENTDRTESLHAAEHEHAVPLADALEFVNTGDPSVGAPRERLGSPEAAVASLVATGALHANLAGRPSDAQATRIRHARAALRTLLDANAEQRVPPPGAVELVQSLLAVRPESTLAADAHGLRLGHRHTDDTIGEALSALATPIVDELARGRADRLRVCGNPNCRWTFFDSSPSGRRRWCDMQSCGNRAKAARHRARIRAAKVAEDARGSASAEAGSAGQSS